MTDPPQDPQLPANRSPGDLADSLVARLRRQPRRLVEPLVRGVDGFYMAFQSALKTFGLVHEQAPPQEEVRGESRWGVLPRREGRWPELALPLPDTAVYLYQVESIFRRGAVWRVLEPWEDVAAEVGGIVREAWPDASAAERPGFLDLRHEGGGLVSLVKVVAQDDGTVILSLGQKSAGLRFAEAERLLVSPEERPTPPTGS